MQLSQTRPVAAIAHGVRRRVLGHILANGGGYLSQACSAAELLSTLLTRVLVLGPSIAPLVPAPFSGPPGPRNPDYRSGEGYLGALSKERDRLVFSPSHYALVFYALLVEVGRMDPAGLEQFNQDGSTVEMIGAEHSPGMATTTGSLGQGISQACGIAWGRRRRGESGRTVAFLTDGEFAEGQTWEALAFAGHERLSDFQVWVEANGQCCDGAMAPVQTIEPLAARLEAFGWQAVEVDGHDAEALVAASGVNHGDRPLAVIARTDPCRGLDLLRERAPRLHYLRFTDNAERDRYQAVYDEWMGLEAS